MRQKHPYFTRATVSFSGLHSPGAEAEQPGTAVALFRSRAQLCPAVEVRMEGLPQLAL